MHLSPLPPLAGDVATWSGVVTGGLMLLSPLLFERLGWRGVASTTPTILLYGGSAFFLACIAYQHLYGATVAASGAAAAGPAGAALLQGLVMFGALLYVFGKVSGLRCCCCWWWVGGPLQQHMGLCLHKPPTRTPRLCQTRTHTFTQGAKFSLFKPAEEMVYITLDEDGRTRGKAAIDVVGSQV
jgi:AAA family ATP:ADP antiporter